MRIPRQTRSLPLVAIGIAAVIFLVVSYQYSEYTLSEINRAAIENIHSNASVQITDTQSVLVANLEGVAVNLGVVADALATQGNVKAADAAMSAAQNLNSRFTTEYFWIGSNGSLMAATNGSSKSLGLVSSGNYSLRPYFVGSEHSSEPHFTGAVQSLSNASQLFIFLSQGVFKTVQAGSVNHTTFEGVLGVAIDLTSLGRYLQSQIAPGVDGQIELLDSNGSILYSSDSVFLGKSIWSSTVQAQIPSSYVGAFVSIIIASLQGASGIADLPAPTNNVTIAYTPIFLPGLSTATGAKQFGVLYITLPDTAEGSNGLLISQLRLLSSFIIVAIAGLAVGTAVLFLGWNRQLDETVRKRTSELVSANDQLRTFAQSQTDFVNMAAHQLRTPTQSILGFSEILEDEQDERIPSHELSEDERRAALFSISKNAHRLKKLTDDILSVARIEDNRLQLKRKTFDLKGFILEVIDEAQTSKLADGVRILFQYPDEPLMAYADPDKVEEALTNLLMNALRFSDGKGMVTITASKAADEHVMVSVRDEGKGIDPQILPRLFTKFVSTTSSGTGLGLFIASKLVFANGGQMWAENNDPDGPGATFTFTLPSTGKEDSP